MFETTTQQHISPWKNAAWETFLSFLGFRSIFMVPAVSFREGSFGNEFNAITDS